MPERPIVSLSSRLLGCVRPDQRFTPRETLVSYSRGKSCQRRLTRSGSHEEDDEIVALSRCTGTGALDRHKSRTRPAASSVHSRRVKSRRASPQGRHEALGQRTYPSGESRDPDRESQGSHDPNRGPPVKTPGRRQRGRSEHGRNTQKPRFPGVTRGEKWKRGSENRHRQAMHGADGWKDP